MRSSPWRSAASVGAAIAILALVASCGLLEPRKSEAPEGGGGGTAYVQPQEPATVISNLVNVMAESPHANYPDLFADDFTFIPDPDDVLTLENIYGAGVFDDWDANEEANVGDKIFSRYYLILLDLSEGTVTEDTDSTHTVLHEYKLDVLKASGWSHYRGTASFRIKQNPSDRLWYMSVWRDFRTEASDSSGIAGTWGLLKGQIRATS
jgi:hypothetical protein